MTASALSLPGREGRDVTRAVAIEATTAKANVITSDPTAWAMAPPWIQIATAVPRVDAWDTAAPRKIWSRATTWTPTSESSAATAHPTT